MQVEVEQPSSADQKTVLTKAVLRAAEKLGVRQKELASILHLSNASVSRMKQGTYALEPPKAEFELGAHFVRLYRSLNGVVGGDENVHKAWMRTHNTVLNATPIDRIKTVEGLIDAVQYLDSRRAPL